MMDITNWRDNLFPVVTKWFDDRLAKRAGVIEKVIGIEDTKRYSFDEMGLGGFGEMPKYNGTEIAEMNRSKGFKTTYVTQEFAGKAQIQFKFNKFDLSGESKRVGGLLAQACGLTQMMDFYRLFSNGFTAGYVGGDGKSLFATDHPISAENASTYSNSGTTAFAIAAITATQAAVMRWVAYDGLPFLADFDLLLVSPELEPLCRQYFGANAKLLPGGDYNDNNPVYDMKYAVIKTFTAKQWAIGDSMMMKEFIKLVHGTRPMVIPQKATNPLIQEFVGYMDYTIGWSEPKVIYGHNPA
jgi:hypothetical protein